MAGNEKKPTISDIARKAGVSIATVSRVLRGSDYPVKSEVRERVTVIARQMEYKPNIFSQMLRGSSSREIGIIAPSITNPFLCAAYFCGRAGMPEARIYSFYMFFHG